MMHIGLAVVGVHLFLEWRYIGQFDACSQAVTDYQRRLEAGEPYDTCFKHWIDANRAYVLTTTEYEVTRIGWALLSGVAALAYFALARGDSRSVGLIGTPVQGWMPWFGAGSCIGVGVTAASLPIAAAWLWLGGPWSQVWECLEWDLPVTCVACPIFQEFIYRFAICVPVAARFGIWPAIVASGALFAAMHWVDGTQNPVNAIAGLFLAWAFLKSGTILVPIILHAVGNVIGFSLLNLAATCGLQAVLK
jgi:membrane protease YdiL (CAAX protease family)